MLLIFLYILCALIKKNYFLSFFFLLFVNIHFFILSLCLMIDQKSFNVDKKYLLKLLLKDKKSINQFFLNFNCMYWSYRKNKIRDNGFSLLYLNCVFI